MKVGENVSPAFMPLHVEAANRWEGHQKPEAREGRHRPAKHGIEAYGTNAAKTSPSYRRIEEDFSPIQNKLASVMSC